MPKNTGIKEQKIIIDRKVDSIIKKYFSGNIATINLKDIQNYYNTGEITKKAYDFLKKVNNLQVKEQKGEVSINYVYDLKEVTKIKMTPEIIKIIDDHFDGEIKNINSVVLGELLKKKIITKELKNKFAKIKRAYVKGTLDEVVEYLKEIGI